MGVLSDGLQNHLDKKVIATLAKAKVGIAGSGGLGSNVATMLVRSGIKSIVVVDGDIVAPSNLNRQFFFPKDVGIAKVIALKSTLLSLEPELNYIAHEVWLDESNVVNIFSGCDIVVEAVDKASTKVTLVQSLLHAGFSVVSASGLCGWGFFPMTQTKPAKNFTLVGDFTNGLEKGLPPMAPRVMQAAAMQADAVLSHLLGSVFTQE